LEEKNKYSCEEHIDRAIDDFLVEFETFPEMGKENARMCNYCSAKAAYILMLTTEPNPDNNQEE
jgi:hypothetical protein